MQAILQSLLFVNIGVFVLLVSLTWSRRLYIQCIVACWTITVVGVLYLLTDTVGAYNPRMSMLGLDLPWYAAVPWALSVVAIGWRSARPATLSAILLLCLCSIPTLMSEEGYIVELANQAVSTVHLMLMTGGVLIAFNLAVLGSISFFWTKGESIVWSVFRITGAQIREYWIVLLKGLGWFALSFAVTNIWVEGNIANLYLVQSPGTFLRDALFTTFYLVWIKHFVFIALAKYVIDILFPDQPTSMGEIFLFACLFAGFQYSLPIGLIVREFLFGLIFGYWYLKTRSLSYGIVLRSLSMIFT